MSRAKFYSEEEQRKFFASAKKSLKMGSRKLSVMLGLKSRGGLEGYSSARTAPPVEIVKKLEKLTGVKANYQLAGNKVCNKKRAFLPMDPEQARTNLKKVFGKDFYYLETLIKSDSSITEIISKLRDKEYHFDNSNISRCIGAYRTNLLSKIVEEISAGDNEIIISGRVRQDKGTLALTFNLLLLYKILARKEIRVGLELAVKRDKVRVFPLEFGRKLMRSSGAIKILLTEKSEFLPKSKIKIILNPKNFGFTDVEAIYDSDARIIAKPLLEQGFILDKNRGTPFSLKGDLSLYFLNKHIILEITRATTYQAGYFKVGQCFVQNTCSPDSLQFLVCQSSFLTKECINALNKIGVIIIDTSFGTGWEKEVVGKIKKVVKNES
ncbi:MAG: hypothetical protein PHH08_00075 [Candidatus ainarchaeum sp.]|nr:hypothetical protein [Candidatus ainarchaeum sp.]